MADGLQDDLMKLAQAAVESSADEADKLYGDLIDALHRAFGHNDKEVAAQLQRLAKSIEDSGNCDGSFAFKQRTCEIMLRKNMELRRQTRQAPHAVSVSAAAQPPRSLPKRLLGSLEYVCQPTDNCDRDIKFYRDALQADVLFEHKSSPKTAGIKTASGPLLLLIETKLFSSTMPVYSVDARSVLEQLETNGAKPISVIECGIGALHVFADLSGNNFAVAQKTKNA